MNDAYDSELKIKEINDIVGLFHSHSNMCNVVNVRLVFQTSKSEQL